MRPPNSPVQTTHDPEMDPERPNNEILNQPNLASLNEGNPSTGGAHSAEDKGLPLPTLKPMIRTSNSTIMHVAPAVYPMLKPLPPISHFHPTVGHAISTRGVS